MKKLLVLGHISYSRPFLYNYQTFVINPFLLDLTKVPEFDAVVFTGGEDLNPKLYNEHLHPRTYFTKERDEIEVLVMEKCLELGIPTIGICRGMQLQTVMNGGKLVQHIDHHDYHHPVTLFDNRVIQINSLHHQLCIPNGNFNLLAWYHPINKHVRYEGSYSIPYILETDFKDPEALWFPETSSLGVQYHPEMMDVGSDGFNFFQELLNTYIGK